MKVLSENEEYLDMVAVETMKTLMMNKPPMSQEDSIQLATISYKQALAMLEIKINLEAVLNKTKFLQKARRENSKDKKL